MPEALRVHIFAGDGLPNAACAGGWCCRCPSMRRTPAAPTTKRAERNLVQKLVPEAVVEAPDEAFRCALSGADHSITVAVRSSSVVGMHRGRLLIAFWQHFARG